jgi:hypothetical protein
MRKIGVRLPKDHPKILTIKQHTTQIPSKA